MTVPTKNNHDDTVIKGFDGITEKERESGEADSASEQSDEQQKPWVLISVFLVLSALLQSVKPSDPYIPYYYRDELHFEQEQINNGPQYRTYGMAIFLPIVSYAAEYLTGYIPPIVFGLLCRWLSQFTFFYGTSVFWMKFSYGVFGLSHSTKTIYSAFTYSMVPVHVFHRITSYIRGANLVAHVLGGSMGQLIIDNNRIVDAQGASVSSFFIQFTVSQACVGLGVLCFFAAIYVNHINKTGSSAALANIRPPVIRSRQDLWNLLCRVYQSTEIRVWSLWFIFSFACVDAIWDYQSVLFKAARSDGFDYTGYVTSFTRLACATAAVLAGRSRSLFANWDLAIITLSGGAISFCLCISSLFPNLTLLYVMFCLTMLINEFCICAITAQIAVKTEQSLRGIILLLNMTLAMIFQSILQAVFDAMKLRIDGKYMGLSLSMALFTGFMFIFTFGSYCRKLFNYIRNKMQRNQDHDLAGNRADP